MNQHFNKKVTKKVPGKGGLRFYKSVGLGFKTPKSAIEGTAPGPCRDSVWHNCIIPEKATMCRVRHAGSSSGSGWQRREE